MKGYKANWIIYDEVANIEDIDFEKIQEMMKNE